MSYRLYCAGLERQKIKFFNVAGGTLCFKNGYAEIPHNVHVPTALRHLKASGFKVQKVGLNFDPHAVVKPKPEPKPKVVKDKVEPVKVEAPVAAKVVKEEPKAEPVKVSSPEVAEVVKKVEAPAPVKKAPVKKKASVKKKTVKKVTKPSEK